MEKIGEKFMRKVFAAAPGDLVIAWNEPETVCYLVQIIDQEQSTLDLHKRFVENRLNPQQASGLAQIHQQEVEKTLRKIFEELDSRLKVRWPGRPLDKGRRPYSRS